MKKILLSLLALAVVVPFVASAHTLLDEFGQPVAHVEQDNGNPFSVTQSWGKTGFNTPVKDCQLFVGGPVVQCFDLSAPKTTPVTPQEQLIELQEDLVALLTQLLDLLMK